MKVSLVLSTINRAHLLELHFLSILAQNFRFCELEIVVVNDGFANDKTKDLCCHYGTSLNIKYVFAGHRNKDKLIPRNPCLANNIGIQNATGDIVILTCPEIFELNKCIELLTIPLVNSSKLITIPEYILFDDNNQITHLLLYKQKISINHLKKHYTDVEMPFFLGVWRKELLSIRGYDEDFLDGYAAEDNDLVSRLLKSGLKYFKTKAQIMHLYHGKRCDSAFHYENPKWVHNYNLLKDRRFIITRNINKDWGKNVES
jgi:glycosyltransferase involved in cell wall biosynthesis